MTTKKYKVTVKQDIIFEIDNDKEKHKDIIKDRLKTDPPYVGIIGGDCSHETEDKVKILSIKEEK